ncbi:kinase-like protein, partial [Lepidopterella palustris CBS 459.81]
RGYIRFGEYLLGQTVSEADGVKVKIAWHRDIGMQFAIRLYRRKEVNKAFESDRWKIYREVAIQRELNHPNIQRLHELVETEKFTGLVLEYTSGGQLFEYVLNHRYLKDSAARRLFAQLVSAVGYLHLKGIVHRNLKLETLQLDRNQNVIVTCFDMANTFDPKDELSEEIEYNPGNREFVQRLKLAQGDKNGSLRGDLMQTSCGSPCYAAPELVVSDNLYTGRKADIWSCGVILYAMLAGHLPFDDDPANPEGDNNIILLYKYIISTPLTFPENVTPHSRDLLRRILVPDPRKRCDILEIARHSWLRDYAHVLKFLTSTTTTKDIADMIPLRKDEIRPGM